MLYTFKSPVAANLIMLQPNGERILEIIGKPASPQGIIVPDQMPAAISALETAVAQEDAAMKKGNDSAKASGNSVAGGSGISLRQRAAPFIDMLRRSHQAGKEVVWGV